MRKKILGYLTGSHDLSIDLDFNKNFFYDISKKFSKFYIIQLSHLIKRKTIIKSFKTPKNFIIFTPKTYDDLIKFLKNYEVIAFTTLGRSFEYFKILYLLKKYSCKLLINLNLGFKNPAANVFFFNKNKFINIENFLFFFFWRKFSFFIFRFFVLINLFPKIEILFEGSKKNKKIIDNYLGKRINKIFKKIDISYIKKIIHINSRGYDELITKVKNKEEKFIVFLDSGFDNRDIILREGKRSEEDRKKYYFYLNNILSNLKKNFKKKIIVCLHPKTDIKSIRKNMPEYKYVKYKTQYYILKSYLILFHDTSAIIEGFFLQKKIINLQSSIMGKYYDITNKIYPSLLKIPVMNMEDYYKLNNTTFKKELFSGYINYNKIIKDLITFNIKDYYKIIRNKNSASYMHKFKTKKGSEQIIEIVKKNFFKYKNNNFYQ
jgi:hypothetical protein